MKSDQVLKKLATMVLCSVKIWMTVDEPRAAEVDRSLNYSMEEAQVTRVMKNYCSLSDCP